LWTCDKQAAKLFGLNLIPGEHGDGLRGDGVIRYGGNSGYQAVNLAYLWGAGRILLLGYDMGHNGLTHYFGDHPNGIQVNSPFKMFMKCFETIRPKDYGIEIINCTPGSKLDCFPRMDIAKALEHDNTRAKT